MIELTFIIDHLIKQSDNHTVYYPTDQHDFLHHCDGLMHPWYGWMEGWMALRLDLVNEWDGWVDGWHNSCVCVIYASIFQPIKFLVFL